MITTYCKLSGMPIAVSPAFSEFLKAKMAIHPIFGMELNKLLDMASSLKLAKLSGDECYLLGLALLKTTDLVLWRQQMAPREDYTERQLQQLARFASVARDTAIGVAELRRSPKQVASLYKDLPLFHVTDETNTDQFTNWAKMVSAKARLYVDTGKARRKADSDYALALYMVDDDSEHKPKKARAINREYELPQVFDSDIGLWAYDKFTDEYSQEALTLHEAKFKQVYSLLVLNKTASLKLEQLTNLTNILSTALPLDTPYNARCAQLTLAYIDKVRNSAVRKLAESIGEQVTTEVRTVGDQSWSFVLLATSTSSTTGAGSGAVGASVATKANVSVKGGGYAASPKGHALDTNKPVANIAQAAPVAAPQSPQINSSQLARLRARLSRG